MVGVNIGVAAPMAFSPFSGWKQSFFGDLHAHGKDAIAFYTEEGRDDALVLKPDLRDTRRKVSAEDAVDFSVAVAAAESAFGQV